jgi:4-diphosphocytidyl-2C-methyl-D-erythritol kinase
LLRAGATAAAMTGSGSSVFGIFPDAASRDRAQNLFTREAASPVSFLNTAQYRKAWYRALRTHISPETLKENLWPPRSAHV